MNAPAPPWKQLLAVGRAETEAILTALPEPLRQKAFAIPIVLEPRPSPAMQKEGIADDTLGLFVGESFPEAFSGVHDLPPQILLFLENIWSYAEQHTPTYREEIRRTYLHELGHYLGLDESDLTARDLD